jgi:hypothetical protein
MLKTALTLACFGATTVAALAFETPKFDRKIERAAIVQVGKKMGALRETLATELPVSVTEIAAQPELDTEQTAGIASAAPMQGPAMPEAFWFVAGVYE